MKEKFKAAWAWLKPVLVKYQATLIPFAAGFVLGAIMF